MARDLPLQLGELVEEQLGVVSRTQILQAGLSRAVIAARLDRGSWQRVFPGVYAAFSGEPARAAVLWAAVLHAGPGAMLSHQTAAELDHLTDASSSRIHLTVPSSRRVRGRPELSIHYSAQAALAVHPVRNPPRTRIEETVLDLWESAVGLDDAVSWVTRGLGRRLTTQAKLRQAADVRSRLRRRLLLVELLSRTQPASTPFSNTGMSAMSSDRITCRRVPGKHGLTAAAGRSTETRYTRTTTSSLSLTAASRTRATSAGRTSPATMPPPLTVSRHSGTAGYRSLDRRARSRPK